MDWDVVSLDHLTLVYTDLSGFEFHSLGQNVQAGCNQLQWRGTQLTEPANTATNSTGLWIH